MRLYSQPPRAVLFDFNGTLNDMSVVLEQDIIVGREQFGLELTPPDVIACWGTPPEEFYPKLFGRNGDNRPWQEMRRVFQSYDNDIRFRRRLLSSVIATLDILDNARVITGIVTSGPRPKVLQYMGEAGLAPDRFSVLHTYDEIGPDIASGLPLLGRALGELSLRGVSAGETVFVGDEPVTMRDAAAAGTGYAVVASGTVSKENLLDAGVPPARLIDNLGQLPELLGIACT